MTVQDTLIAEINTNLPTNNANQITAAILRGVLIDMVNVGGVGGTFTTTDGTIVVGQDSFPSKSALTDYGIQFGSFGRLTSGLFTEVDGTLLSYAINVPQIGNRDDTQPGGIFRLDTRTPGGASNGFIVFAYPANSGSVPNPVFQVDLTATPIARVFGDFYLPTGASLNWGTGAIRLRNTATNFLLFDADTTGNMVGFQNTNAGGNGPQIPFYHGSASPAVNDIVTTLNFQGNNTTPALVTYGSISCTITVTTPGAEGGALDFSVQNGAGALTSLRLGATAFRPLVNDSHTLGAATLAFGDLFLASGGVINWNNGAAKLFENSGCLVIGTASNTTAEGLQLQGTDSVTSGFGIYRWANDVADGDIRFFKSRGASIGSNSIVQVGDQLGSIAWNANNGSAFLGAALIKAFVDTGTPGASSMPGRIEFSTTPDASTAVALRMSIFATGSINVGATSPTNQTSFQFSVMSALASNCALFSGTQAAGNMNCTIQNEASNNTANTTSLCFAVNSDSQMRNACLITGGLTAVTDASRIGTLKFQVSNSASPTTSMYINGKSIVCGDGAAALATNATSGFLYIPTCAGTPSGTPGTQTGTVAMVYDTTNNKLYIYNGAWKGGTAPGAWT